jgi:hypothetical protein
MRACFNDVRNNLQGEKPECLFEGTASGHFGLGSDFSADQRVG